MGTISLSKCRSGVDSRNIERKVGVSLTIKDMESINDSNIISNNGNVKYSSTKHNNINSNDNVDYNPSYNKGVGLLGDNNNQDIEYNKTNNNNNNVEYNPLYDIDGGSVWNVNKYDCLCYHWCDADVNTSSIKHNNIMNDNNIHYSSLSCNNDGSSLKYSDDNMKVDNTKRNNNMINNNSVSFDPLYEIDDSCLGSLFNNEDRLVACQEFIIYFIM